MDARKDESDLGQLASEAGGLMTGLGILSTTFFPFALPAVVMTLPLVIPLVVLAVPAALLWLLVRGVIRAGRAIRVGMAVGRAGVRPSA
jgi:hypothetical protein